ncbi:YjjG family noncanonical pyrimidine nucleotidase [Zobellia galactanivorans]|uniref:YjjG family noncanonical pyrimidine nucleotidase n=1 Tax=Zobellia galactanivorans (strain DSM 12802 / CCUG 47099 / CIP 106680 / NCIMB 13871 / Dsij) TaxID=63186 RepID=UPI0026E3C502|nr:YjjG family noncanonical pyrimidine nucleotidase [Zobellia galactanivorans]MDO6807118.1 YjjG family noncanonical pyrimidine nucleotidase [Zobellia galactanivorans]
MFKNVVTDVFFDLDHTLWDFEKNSALTFEKIFQENAIEVALPDFLEVYIPANFAFWKLYREEKISKEDLRYQRLKSVFDDLKYPVPDKTINKLSDEYIRCLSSFNHLFPNVTEILDYLKPKYKLHIITNGFQEVQEKKLKNSNIYGYFDQIIDSEMAGVKKPDPFIFELALRRAETRPENSLMIGDNLEADILGAQAVGYHALHFNAHQGPKHDFCEIIDDLHEIKTFL